MPTRLTTESIGTRLQRLSLHTCTCRKGQLHWTLLAFLRSPYELLLEPALLQVTIQGFKSYKDQTVADPFSEKINVVGKCSISRAAVASMIQTVCLPLTAQAEHAGYFKPATL